MANQRPEERRAELIRFRLEELKHLLEEVGERTKNKRMKDVRNQLAHCAITYSPYGTVFMEEKLVMRQLGDDFHPLSDQQLAEDGQGNEKVYVTVNGKRKILYHVYPLEKWEELYKQLQSELSQAGALIPLPRVTIGCPRCGDFPAGPSGHGQVICHHVSEGIEKAYRRDAFGDIIGHLTFRSSSGNMG